jgi:hypothetical protein
VGLAVGKAVGYAVGDTVGLAVGKLVGYGVGYAVGDTVGELVGYGVGIGLHTERPGFPAVHLPTAHRVHEGVALILFEENLPDGH